MGPRGWPGQEEEFEARVLTGVGILVLPDVSLGSAGGGKVGFLAASDLNKGIRGGGWRGFLG